MSFLNKLLRKSQKTSVKQDHFQEAKKKTQSKVEPAAKKELTIAELKEKSVSTAKDGKKTVREAVKKDDTKKAYKYLVRPMVTEKGTYLGVLNKYIFKVDSQANKVEIKKAIKAVYGVSPIAVNIITLSGKKVRYGKTKGETKGFKKAIVTLKENDKIEAYEGV